MKWVKKIRKYWKKEENRCNSANSGGGEAMRWSGVPIVSKNNKVYGWKAVDYGLNESDKEKHEKATFSNET
jgi:hypothetical protein